MTRALLPWMALCLAACVTSPLPVGDTVGMPLDAFIDDLKLQLREVHWHVRGNVHGCGHAELRELDLRDGQLVLAFERVAQVNVNGSVKLVAIPLGAVVLGASAGGEWTQKASQELTVKLAVTGAAPVVDIDHAPQAKGPVAQALNAAIDGFIRSDNAQPCLQVAALKLAIVVDVARSADGGFRIVVPAVGIEATRSLRQVNTLTLDWDRVVSNRVH